MAKRHHLDRRANDIAERLADGDPDDMLKPKYVADKLGVSTQWLELGRAKGYGPDWKRFGPRMVRYQRAATLAWLRSRPQS
jgi:hypothetical protein